jgi:signal transduction histidine kinase
MATLDSVPGAGVLVDETHTIVDGNVRAEIVFREDMETLQNTTLETLREWDLFEGADLNEWRQHVDAVLSGERESATGQVTLTPDGSNDTYVYELRVRPLDGAQTEESKQVCCSFRSVGTSQRYEETVTALHAATRKFMTAEDIDGVLRMAAVAAHEVLGFPGTTVRRYDPDAELLRHVAFGARINNIQTRPPYPVDDSPHGQAFRRDETVIDDIEDKDPFDRDVFTQAMYIPIGDTGTLSIGTVGNRFDEIDAQFGEILAENAAAAIRVVDTKASLRRERERLDKFASVVSHDLRNPLEIARMYLDLAEDSGDPDDFDTAAAALDRMDQMIDDLLAMARADTKLNRLESLDIDRLVRESWRNVSTDDVKLHSEIPDGTTVSADPNLLQNVFENLFRNSIEHGLDEQSVEQTDLTVTVGMLAEERGLYVADDGQGIPPAQRADVFEHGYTTQPRGTGLGLSIVETLVEAHGWSVSVTDSESGGVRFEIRFAG